MKDKKLIFLISLPRSGSTLLQRMLTASPEIHSTSETWLMLPLAYMIQREGILATYSHKNSVEAVEDFIKTMPNGYNDFYESVGTFAQSLYNATSPDVNAKHFLDKTPRYYLITPFLANVFPKAKFIFLFRNPLEVLSSMLTTWLKDRFILYYHYIDLFCGPVMLSEGFNQLKARSLSVNYSDLIMSPENEIKRICSYLEIPYSSELIDNYGQIQFKGRMGDPKGINKYDSITDAPLNKWKVILNTKYRKWYSKKYIRHLGDEILQSFDLSVNKVINDIDSINDLRNGSIKDIYYHLLSHAMRLLNYAHFKKLIKSFKNNDYFFPYT